MAVKAADVAKLRKATGAGMMDCKKALVESDGDFDVAVSAIRKRGMAIANKRADREASEGVVLAKVSADEKIGYLIALNCETDFVAKNEAFINFATSILDKAIATNATSSEEVLAMDIDGKTVETLISEQTGIIGEKLELSKFEKIEAEKAVAYIHAGNKLATLIGFNANIDTQAGRDVAMQVAAMAPLAIDKEDIDADIVAKELEIGKEKARLEGKPEQMLDKIAQGRLGKFFKETTLLNQDFIKDGKMSVKQYIQTENKNLTIVAMKRVSLNA